TREIKPGGPGIGRRVKVKTPLVGRGSPVPPAARREKEPLPVTTKQPPPPPPSSISNGHHTGWGATHNGARNNNNNSNISHLSQQKPATGMPDIMRRPIRERVIHLLALRPYKKPELFDRISREGCRERDKNMVMNLLKQVSFMRDNTYQLQRHVWNDVQEDWPFYSEQERQILK
ncbi:unnamed protein product, partial [Timema podura]|nr:unnamed protein product [Timema podura]